MALPILAGLGGLAAAYSLYDQVTGTTAERNADLAYGQWKKQFDYASAYNTPANQRQRLIDGGYNPALAVGGNMTNTHSPNPQLGQAKHEAPNALPAIMAFQGIQNQKAQEALTRSQTDLNEQEFRYREDNNPTKGALLGSQLTGQNYRNEYQSIINANQQDVYDLQKQGMDLNNQQTRKFISQMDPKFRVEMSKAFAQLANIKEDTQLKEAQQTAIKSQNELRSSQTASTRAETITKAMEASARMKGTSYSDNPIMRSLIEIANGIKNRLKGSQQQKEQAQKEATLLEWILDPSTR